MIVMHHARMHDHVQMLTGLHDALCFPVQQGNLHSLMATSACTRVHSYGVTLVTWNTAEAQLSLHSMLCSDIQCYCTWLTADLYEVGL